MIPTINNCLLYTTLTLNSTTLFVSEKQELIAQHGLHDIAEAVSSQAVIIHSSKKNAGSLPLTLSNQQVSLASYYVKYILPSNDIVTVITAFADDLPRVLPVNVLESILSQYRAYEEANTSANHSKIEFKVIFNQIIKFQEAEFNKSALETAKLDLDQVKLVMNDNIEQVLERNERINLLVNKTDRITTLSNSFRTNAVKVKRKMWWQNVKFWVLIGVVVTVLVLILFEVLFG